MSLDYEEKSSVERAVKAQVRTSLRLLINLSESLFHNCCPAVLCAKREMELHKKDGRCCALFQKYVQFFNSRGSESTKPLV
jgi:hypothetical protein